MPSALPQGDSGRTNQTSRKGRVMPLSEENKALIERVLGAITANEALNEDIFTTDEVIDLIEAARAEQRSKAEASLGGEGFSSRGDE